jgi:hypothetical protein
MKEDIFEVEQLRFYATIEFIRARNFRGLILTIELSMVNYYTIGMNFVVYMISSPKTNKITL